MALVTGLALAATGAPAVAQDPSPATVAHRGASAYAPENTVAATRLAAEQGATMVELDVRRTADDRLVVIRDETLERTTDAAARYPDRAPWRVAEFTLGEIRTLDAGSWFAPAYAGEPVPELGDVLRALGDGPTGLLLEVKLTDAKDGVAELVSRELRAVPGWADTGPDRRRLMVQSLDWEFLREFHALEPDIPLGGLSQSRPAADELDALAEHSGMVHISADDVDADYVALARARGLEVFAYVVNDTRNMRRLIDVGVDGIMTDVPDVLGCVIRA
ncbi:Glycerophosphoryl diester phosphodiesterase [Nocardia otitidiscaviarum]|uniref:Glycerophosphoryl diester phosphodiesterase n=1 Tax=Nocardia otitidiscaviarum TaxID=1823 RepID=A0A379JMA2_9NOCA|nr:glycerophosphodiester phosphodiesterase family protein [Nocardia otitidiscaviarum]SUD49484.1 Glycerophosphoryl diester phosphodiesterase [Nocardia otitidiscaviarum]